MTPGQIEAWALDVVERVRRHELIEDSRVEAKARFIDPAKAARRLAGHANASGGVPVLWLFGLDETEGVVPLDPIDYAAWWESVQAEFDEVSPDETAIIVPTEEGPVVAVLFRTERAPFIVRNPLYGNAKGEVVGWEVPWRDGTRVRTARRWDLIRLLSPLATMPEVLVFGGFLTYGHDSAGTGSWYLSLDLYVDVPVGETLVVADHRLAVDVRWPDWNLPLVDTKLYGAENGVVALVNRGREGPPAFAVRGQGQVIISGPGPVGLLARGSREYSIPVALEQCVVTATFVASRSSRESSFSARLVPVKPGKDEIARWIVSQEGQEGRREDRRVVTDEEGDWRYADD